MTETIDKLYLELSQITTAKTAREIELEDLLTSARIIAERRGTRTAWARFSARLEKAGIGFVTAKTFRVLPDDEEITPGTELIAAERERQTEVKGWTAEHDDTHKGGELAVEAANWALEGTSLFHGGDGLCGTHQERMDKPRIRQLVIAGALIAAEIDRLQRTATQG